MITLPEYETVIGLEVHIQLSTQSKAFSAELNRFDLSPNINISSISLGLPGTLPRASRLQLEKGIKLGMALGCNLPEQVRFDRKNYFYPDLPKGYQITQEKMPLATGGSWSFETEGKTKSIRIHHIHMEEDAGKSNHESNEYFTLVEFNRAGTPLIELVTEPDFRSGQEVYDFLTSLQQLVQYLGISDGNMEEGSIRCDCNVSVRPSSDEQYGERCEIKNVNSRRFAREAITSEAQRQINLLKQGLNIERTTLLFDAVAGITKPMRKKEGQNDYRYFPEPDLSPIFIDNQLLSTVRKDLGILPREALCKLLEVGINADDARRITHKKEDFEYFTYATEYLQLPASITAIFMVNKLIPYAEQTGKKLNSLLSDQQLSDVIALYQSGQAGKADILSRLLPAVLENSEYEVMKMAEKLNLIIGTAIDDLNKIIEEIIDLNADKVREYQKGKKGLAGFFMGQVKQKLGTAADGELLKSKIEAALNERKV